MQSGTLRHRVILQEYTHSQDAYGGVTDAWTTRGMAWASIEPVGGKVFFASRQAQSEVTHRIRVRFGSVSAVIQGATWRVAYGGDFYGVVAAMPDNRRTMVVLLCTRQSSRQELESAQGASNAVEGS